MSASADQPAQQHCDTCRCSYVVKAGFLPSNVQDLDDYIHALRSRMSEAHGQRNYLTAAACRLPVEILEEIFLYSRDIADSKDFRLWIPVVSHVCAFWRAAAISWTQLWTQPDLGYSELAAEMIRRAGRAPITLRLVTPASRPTWMPEVYKAISVTSWISIKAIDFTKIHRLDKKVMNIKPLYKVRFKYISGIIARSRHHVQHIKFVHQQIPHRNSPPDLPSRVKDVTYPRLETLHLTGWNFTTWTIQILANSKLLRSLTIDGSCNGWSWAQDNPTELLKILGRLPRLEHFTLAITASRRTVARPPAYPPLVQLPRLSRLQLTKQPSATLALVEGLQLPPECHISHACREWSEAADDAALLRRLFTPAPHTVGIRVLEHTLEVHTYTDSARRAPHHSATIRTWSRTRDARFNALSNVFSELPQYIELSVFCAYGQIERLLRAASAETIRWEWAGLPTSTVHLRDLLIHGAPFPHLTTVVFSGLDLADDVGERSAAEYEEVMVALACIPTLRTLRLVGCAGISEQLLMSWRMQVLELVVE